LTQAKKIKNKTKAQITIMIAIINAIIAIIAIFLFF